MCMQKDWALSLESLGRPMYVMGVICMYIYIYSNIYICVHVHISAHWQTCTKKLFPQARSALIESFMYKHTCMSHDT